MCRKQWFSVVGFVALVVTMIACGKSGNNSVTGLNNEPPHISSILVIPDGMVPWAGTARLKVAAEDRDGDTSRLTYSWKSASGSQVGPNFSEATYQHNGVVRDNDVVTVTVMDQVGGVSTSQTTLRIAGGSGARPTPTPGGPGAPGTGIGDTSPECVSITAPCLLVNGSRSSFTGSPRERVTVTVPSGPGGRTDWVGMHRWPGEHEERLEKQYLNGSTTPPAAGLTTATLSFELPSTPGDYNFRFFSNDTVNLLSTSAVITVRQPPSQPNPPTPTPKPGEPTAPPTPEPTNTPTPVPTATPTPAPTPTPTPKPNSNPSIDCPGTQSGVGEWSGSAGINASDPDGDNLTCNVSGVHRMSASTSGCSSVNWTSCVPTSSGCWEIVELEVLDGKGGRSTCSFTVQASYN